MSLRTHALALALLASAACTESAPTQGRLTPQDVASAQPRTLADALTAAGIELSDSDRVELARDGHLLGRVPRELLPVRQPDGTLEVPPEYHQILANVPRTGDLARDSQATFETMVKLHMVDLADPTYRALANQALGEPAQETHAFAEAMGSDMGSGSGTGSDTGSGSGTGSDTGSGNPPPPPPPPPVCTYTCTQSLSMQVPATTAISCGPSEHKEGFEKAVLLTISCATTTPKECATIGNVVTATGGEIRAYGNLSASATIATNRHSATATTNTIAHVAAFEACDINVSKDVANNLEIRLGAEVSEEVESKSHVGAHTSTQGQVTLDIKGKVAASGSSTTDINASRDVVDTMHYSKTRTSDSAGTIVEARGDFPVLVPLGGSATRVVRVNTNGCTTSDDDAFYYLGNTGANAWVTLTNAFRPYTGYSLGGCPAVVAATDTSF